MTLNFFMQNLINALQWGSFYALIAYSIVLAILLFKPHGLFGEAYSARLRL
jgi:branched-subunit amino acid ABC-type transport system permease component